MQSSPTLHVYLFARFQIEREGEPVDLPTRKDELLLAYLLLHPRSHSRERLAARFWRDVPDSSARASLRNALAVLRRQLGRQMLQTDRERAQINPAYPVWVDALEFKTQATHYLQAPSPAPAAVDLTLYKGDLLVDFYDEWVIRLREEFRTLYIQTLLAFTQQMRSQSAYERAIEYAERILAIDRAYERAHQHIMFCSLALGDRDAALRQYEVCRQALGEELDVEPAAATKKLRDWIAQAPMESSSVEAVATNLPIPLTSFIGRQQEMAEVKELLSSNRLLTLTGTGGSGKTRLAIQIAIDLLDAYPDGVWWVELAEVGEGEGLPRAVAKALGVPEVPQQAIVETLVNYLRSRKLLLLLDNCEHLIADCAHLVERLLGESSQLQILATSREMLGAAGERVRPVPPLPAPDPARSLPFDRLRQYEAVRLFAGRAAAISPNFKLTEQNGLAVAEICSRLEGLPLAIELAAARTHVLSAEQIKARLDDAVHLLTSGRRTALPRHQTLRATIDWSYDLLSAEERTLLRRLSVFSGGWTFQSAEAICTGEGIAADGLLNLLTQLVDKSLVQAQPQGKETRFRMLQTIRQYSRERLLEAGEQEAVRRRHLGYFMHLAEAADPHLGIFLSEADTEAWQPRLEAENHNLRAAIRWSLGQEDSGAAEAALRLVGTLHWFWFARGRFYEGHTWLKRLLEIDAPVPAPVRAKALLTAGYLACWRGEFASGRLPLKQALALFQRLENGSAIALSLHGLGFVAMGQGNAPLSRSLFEQSLAKARDLNDQWVMSFASHFLGIVMAYQKEYEQALAYFEEGSTLIQQLGGHKQGVAFGLFHEGRIARLKGDYQEAHSRLAEAMRLFRQLGDRRGTGYSLAGFAVLAAVQGQMERAAWLSGAVASLQDVLGPFLEAPLQMEFDRQLAAVRAALDEETFDAAVAAGRAMTLEEATAYALEADKS